MTRTNIKIAGSERIVENHHGQNGRCMPSLESGRLRRLETVRALKSKSSIVK